MTNFKLNIDVLYTVSSSGEHNIEIEAFGHQQFELLGDQLNMSDIIKVQAVNPIEAINKAYTMIKDQYSIHHIGYYTGVDGKGAYGYLNVQYQACHIQMDMLNEKEEAILEEINAAYYNLI